MCQSKPAALTIEDALSAQLELLSGGASGASTYRVQGLAELCVLKVVAAESVAHLRARGYREIRFYEELAASLPLRTPRVLANLTKTSGFCALLLAAYTPMESANRLSDEGFIQIARQLARFHAVYWNRVSLFDDLSWVEKPKNLDLTHDARHASATWRALAQQTQFQELLTVSTLRDIEKALAEVGAKPEYGSETVMTLCHGDCHLDNLLRDQADRLVWADWQEVRVGYGPNDLTFFLQRAEANGATIEHDKVVAAYSDALEAAGVGGVNPEAIKSAMNESERRTRLLYWPDYLRDAEAKTMMHHLARIFST